MFQARVTRNKQSNLAGISLPFTVLCFYYGCRRKPQRKLKLLCVFIHQILQYKGDKIIGKLDESLLNKDIAAILKTQVLEDFESFLDDEEASHQAFG